MLILCVSNFKRSWSGLFLSCFEYDRHLLFGGPLWMSNFLTFKRLGWGSNKLTGSIVLKRVSIIGLRCQVLWDFPRSSHALWMVPFRTTSLPRVISADRGFKLLYTSTFPLVRCISQHQMIQMIQSSLCSRPTLSMFLLDLNHWTMIFSSHTWLWVKTPSCTAN